MEVNEITLPQDSYILSEAIPYQLKIHWDICCNP